MNNLSEDVSSGKSRLFKAGMFIAGLIIIIAAVVIIKVNWGDDSLSGWREFKSIEGRFTVLMPGIPNEQEQVMNSEMGALNVKSFTIEQKIDTSTFVYGVSYVDYDTSFINQVSAEAVLNSSRDGAVENMNGELLSEKIISINSYPGRELKVKIFDGKGMIRSRLYLVNKRLYSVLSGFDRKSDFYENIFTFLESFKIIEE